MGFTEELQKACHSEEPLGDVGISWYKGNSLTEVG